LTATDGKETEVLEAAIAKVKRELAGIVDADATEEETNGADTAGATAGAVADPHAVVEAAGAAVPSAVERASTATMDSIKSQPRNWIPCYPGREMLAVKRATDTARLRIAFFVERCGNLESRMEKIDQPVRVMRQLIDRSTNVNQQQAALNIQKFSNFSIGTTLVSGS